MTGFMGVTSFRVQGFRGQGMGLSNIVEVRHRDVKWPRYAAKSARWAWFWSKPRGKYNVWFSCGRKEQGVYSCNYFQYWQGNDSL